MYDLEGRTLEFSKRVIRMTKVLIQNDTNRIFINQIVRSSSSVGANYREANDALGKKDFIHRLKISRKEAKESKYWLDLIAENNPMVAERMKSLLQENTELIKILSAIISKTEMKQKEIKDTEQH